MKQAKSSSTSVTSISQFARGRGDQKGIRRFLKPRRLFVFAFLSIIMLVMGALGWLSYRANAALNQISDGSEGESQGLFSFLNKPDDALLEGEADGRVNILFLGMGGKGHPGGQLTDTVMIASIMPEEGKVALFSLPRDLYVPIPDHNWAKLNSAHAVGEQAKAGTGPALAKQTVSDVAGIPIHYYVRIDFDGFVKLVDALGGVDITVEKAIADPFYPDDALVGYDPFYLKAGQRHMDGEIALKYARSRETTSDFDRARRQQQLIGALKDKALSAGVLLNPKKLTEFLDILGTHVRTDLSAWEMERFLTLAKTLNTDQISNRVFDTASDSPLTSKTDPRAGYIIVPRSGNFDELRAEIDEIVGETDDTSATISIENASGTSSIAGNAALLLRGYGYQVDQVSTAKATRQTSQLLVADPVAYPTLKRFLEERFSVTATASGQGLSSDFVLVIGKDYASKITP